MEQTMIDYQRARARYAYMLRLPPDFTLARLKETAEQFEQCRYGMDHQAWRDGYFGLPHTYGRPSQWRDGVRAAADDLCPMVPPGLPIEDAQQDWSQFEDYYRQVQRHSGKES